MKKYQVKYGDGFKDDIFKIIDYIENDLNDPLGATKAAIKIYQKCESLAVFPKGARVRHVDEAGKGLRFTHAKKYIIVYYIDEATSAVHIRAVINSQRDILSMLKGRNSGAK